jgi:hypothetical protein
MTAERNTRLDRLRGFSGVPPDGPLRALQLIETVRDGTPFNITPVVSRSGSVVSQEEAMAARVKWATKARYTVLSRDIPKHFAPYNAVIRIIGTEDYRADYLAVLHDGGQDND